MTLAPPLLSKTDEYGTGLGLLSAGQYLTSSALQKVHSFSYTTVAELGEGPKGLKKNFLRPGIRTHINVFYLESYTINSILTISK